MANKIDHFWEIFKAVVADPDDPSTVTTSTNAIAKSDRTKVESYFSNVIDQYTFETEDYNRLRKFMIDLYASFRTQSTISLSSSDPHALANTDLDELFRSMGYNLSASLKGVDENPLEQKVQFFLDLVNLYKVKGTPQSLVDILQYYGVTKVDIYEFFLKKYSSSNLLFNGKAVAGTTINPSNISIQYENLTEDDPHWLYTEQQILQLDKVNKINLPSKSPYLGVQPTIELEGAEISIIQRLVQDQYDSYISTGVLPTADAEITYNDELKSFLVLYLACIYMFNELYDAGYDDYLVKPKNFVCYDGTTTSEIEIISEYDLLTKEIVLTRSELKTRYDQHIEAFTRPVSTDFLINKNTAGVLLNSIDPTFKSELDDAGDQSDVMYSLLKDLALWVRTNIGYGFINFGFILYGVNEFFNDLKPVIDFFKPYHTRLLLLEVLQIKNRLFNTIVIEDEASVEPHFTFHDFATGNGKVCCNLDDSTCVDVITVCKREFVDGTPSHNWKSLWTTETTYAVDDAVASGLWLQYICIQAHESGYETKPETGVDWALYWVLMSKIVCTDDGPDGTYYSRETYDCGSYHDIGVVTDIRKDLSIEVEDVFSDHLRCPPGDDATGGAVVSEITSIDYDKPYTEELGISHDNAVISFDDPQLNTNYSVGLSIGFTATTDPLNPEIPLQFSAIVTNKTISTFNVLLSGIIPSENYYIDWFVLDSTSSDIVSIDTTSTSQIITLPITCSDYSISGSISNIIDATTSIYAYTISDKTSNSFRVNFSDVVDSPNYKFEYFVCMGDKNGNIPISSGATTITHTYTTPAINDAYPLTIVLESSGTVYTWETIEKTETGFTVELSDPTDSTNFNLSWTIPEVPSSVIHDFTYYQSSAFRDFDNEGVFDCTHGFDLFEIIIEDVVGYILQEDEFYMLQEDGSRIFL